MSGPFYMDIAEPARKKAAKQLQPEPKTDELPLATGVRAKVFGLEYPGTTGGPTDQPATDYGLGPSTSDVRPALPLAPSAGLSPDLEKFGLTDLYSQALETEAASRPQQPMTEAEMDIYGSTIREPAPTWDPRGREKGMETTAQEAATGGFRGQTVELTPQMAQNESLINSLAARGVKVREVPTFSSEGAGRRTLMALGVAADVIGAPFEVIAETGWESVKFATGTGGVPTLFKEGFVATVEQHRKRSIASQIGLGIVFDPFVLAKVFTLPLKASNTALRASVKSQLVELVDNNGAVLPDDVIEETVEKVVEQVDARKFGSDRWEAYARDNNPLGNFDDPEIGFGAGEMGAGRRDPNMAMRFRDDVSGDPEDDWDLYMRQLDEMIDEEGAGIDPDWVDDWADAGDTPFAFDAGDDVVGLSAGPVIRAQEELEIARFELETLVETRGAPKAPNFGTTEYEEWVAARRAAGSKNKKQLIDEAKAKVDRAQRRVEGAERDAAMREAGPDVAPAMAPGAAVQPSMLGDPQQIGFEMGGAGRMPEQLIPEEGVVAQGVQAAEARAGQMPMPEEALDVPVAAVADDVIPWDNATTPGLNQPRPPKRAAGAPVEVDVYHGTDAPAKSASGLPEIEPPSERTYGGLHFGTEKAAQDYIRDSGMSVRSSRVVPARVRLNKPYGSVDDPVSEAELWDSLAQPDAIRQLREEGFDGIIYRNSAEDPGSVSYWVFDPDTSLVTREVDIPTGAVTPEAAVVREAVDVAEDLADVPAVPPDRPVGVVPEEAVDVPEVTPVRSEAVVKATDDFDVAAAKARDGVPSNLKNEKAVKKADDLVRVLDDEGANVAGLDDLRAAVDDYQSHRASVKGNPKGGANKALHPETVRRVQAVERAVANLGEEAAAPGARAAATPPPAAVIEAPAMPSVEPSAAALEPPAMPVTPSVVEPTVERGAIGSWISSPDVANGAPVKVVGRHGSWDADGVYRAREFDVELPDGSTRRVQADNVQNADVEPAPDIGGAGRGADGEGPPPRDVDGEQRFDEPGDPVPEPDAPKLHQALKNVATQMRMDAQGAFGQFLSLLPGISQIQHWLRPANKIAAHIMKAYIGQGAVRARLMTEMFAEREVVLYPLLREHFGPEALTGAKLPSEIVQYIGSQDEFVEEIANTLLDVAQRPHLYSLNSAQQQALRRWQQYQMKFMNEIIEGYGAKVDIFEVADGSVFLSNINVDDALLEALDINVAQAVGRGRNKHRFYNTAADRYLTIRRNVDEVVEERQRSLETALDRPLTTTEIEDLRSAVQAEKARPFKALTSITDLQAGMDAWKARAAANQTFKVGSQGKTLMQVIDELHPGLRARRDRLARQVKSLRDQITTAERQVMQEGGALRKITPELERAEERLNRLLGRIDEKFDEGVDIDYLSGQAHELLRNFKALEERGIIISERGATGVSKTTMMHERLEELVEELADVRRAYNAASKDDYVFVTEGGLFQYYHAKDAKVIRDLHKTSDNMIIKGLEEIRGTAFAGDLSPLLGVQMPLAFMANPHGVVRALIGAVSGSAKSGDVLRSFRTGTLAQAVAEDLDGWLDFAFYSGREITAGTPQEFAGGLLRFLPGFSKLNESMYSIVLRQTKALYDQQLSILVKQGVSLEEAKATAADLALKVVPMWSPRRLGLAPGREAAVRAGVTSISFLTKPAEMMATASVGFAKLATKRTLSAQERLATRVVATMGATWMSLAVTSAVLDAKAKGRDPWEAAKLAMTPNSGSFGTIKLVGSEKSIPMGGPIRGVVQAVAPQMKEINGVSVPVPFAGLPQFFMNRMTPGLRTQVSLLMDRDFFGGKVTGYLKDPQSSTLGKILRGAAYEVEGLVPLTLGSAMGGIRRGLSDATDPMIDASAIISDSLSQFGGVNMFVESPYTKGDYEARKWAKENNVTGYDGEEIKRRKDLSPRDRKRFEEGVPEVQGEIDEHIKRMGLQKVPWAVTTYKAETTKVEFAGQQQVDDDQLRLYRIDGPNPDHDTGTTRTLSPKKWIEQRRTRMTDLAARRDEIYENLDTQDPKNATDRYYQKFDEIKTKHNNQMSESAWEELDSWVESQTPYDQKWIEENTRLHALTPMVQEWYDDQAVLRGYWQLEEDFLEYLKVNHPLGRAKGEEVVQRWQRYKDAPDHSKHLHGMESISDALSKIRRAYRVKDGTFASIKAREPGDTTKGRQADVALAKWGYSGQPMSEKAREYIVGPMTPDFYNQPVGSTQPQPAAQPSQPQVQPSGGGTFMQQLVGGTSPQPTTPVATPNAGGSNTFMEQLLVGAR